MWTVNCCQNLEDHKNEYSLDHTCMFKRKVFPTIFLKKMHYQCKGYYGKEIVKAVAVLTDLGIIGTKREQILQQIRNISQEHQKSPCHARPAMIP